MEWNYQKIKECFKENTKTWDYLISQSDYTTEKFDLALILEEKF